MKSSYTAVWESLPPIGSYCDVIKNDGTSGTAFYVRKGNGQAIWFFIGFDTNIKVLQWRLHK